MIGKNKISGVVCEFNPLHNGHAALLSRISEEFGSDIVCVMSGNFVQRGEAAVLDKWSRTRLALQNGAALVLELPRMLGQRLCQCSAENSVRRYLNSEILPEMSGQGQGY